MDTKSITTKSGELTIFHASQAGAPELFERLAQEDGGPWFFEPTDHANNDVFSQGYPTREAALEAAEAWEAQQAVESDPDWAYNTQPA